MLGGVRSQIGRPLATPMRPQQLRAQMIKPGELAQVPARGRRVAPLRDWRQGAQTRGQPGPDGWRCQLGGGPGAAQLVSDTPVSHQPVDARRRLTGRRPETAGGQGRFGQKRLDGEHPVKWQKPGATKRTLATPDLKPGPRPRAPAFGGKPCRRRPARRLFAASALAKDPAAQGIRASGAPGGFVTMRRAQLNRACARPQAPQPDPTALALRPTFCRETP